MMKKLLAGYMLLALSSGLTYGMERKPTYEGKPHKEIAEELKFAPAPLPEPLDDDSPINPKLAQLTAHPEKVKRRPGDNGSLSTYRHKKKVTVAKKPDAAEQMGDLKKVDE